MKKILLIATGGTIACSKSGSGLTPTLTASSFINYVPQINEICDLQIAQLLNIDSTNMQPEYWINIVKYIEKNYDDFDGFVITHGTDTMAYTSAALFYMIQNLGKPIVITGGQKPIEYEETDSRKNLINAVRFACEDIGGVFVVFNGKVINGARAAKLKTKSYDAFESINYPYLANIEEMKIEYNKNISIVSKDSKPKFYHNLSTDVFVLKLIPGLDPGVLDYLKSRYSGIIIESYGIGGIPFNKERDFLSKIEEIIIDDNIAIVLTTQVMLEGSDLSVYEVGKRIMEKPIIPSFDMTTEALVTKLMWALGQTYDLKKIKKMMIEPISYDLIPE